jgi:CRISPR/Cas system-associated protein endoribonuclease Cas2
MINFAELKDKLLKFDDYDMKLIRLIKAENQAWTDYKLLSDHEKDEAEIGILKIAEYQFNKDAKIMSALLEIIEMQDKQICILHNYIQHNEDNLVGDDLKGDDRFTEIFKRHVISTNAVLSETDSKLKQLIKGV